MTDIDPASGDQDHIRSAHAVARAAMLGLLAIGFCYGAISTHFTKRHLLQPAELLLVYAAIFLMVTYVWYYYDAIEHRYLRSRGANLAIILLSFAAVPYYLMKSRPRGQRFKALLSLIGFVLVYLMVAVLGEIANRLVGAF